MMVSLIAGWLVLNTAVAPAERLCADQCLVELQTPQTEYVRSATIQLNVRNVSTDKLQVVAVLDEFVDGGWRETPLTVSDQDHGFKVVRLSALNVGATLSLSYPACSALKVVPQGGGGRDVLIQCPEGTPLPPQPVRLHVFVHRSGKLVQEVVSSEYRIVPD